MRKWIHLLPLLVAFGTAYAQTNDVTDPASLRDPFWPVGYAPQVSSSSSVDTGAGQDEVKAGLQFQNLTEEQQAFFRSKLRVSGFMRSGTGYLARINDQLVGAGDSVSVEYEGQKFAFQVRAISKDSVQLEPKQ